MISILIPTHNFDCRPLVKEIHRQATIGKHPFEIIVRLRNFAQSIPKSSN